MRLINRKDREAAMSGQGQPHFAGLRGLPGGLRGLAVLP
jgi:hypothetical protein